MLSKSASFDLFKRTVIQLFKFQLNEGAKIFVHTEAELLNILSRLTPTRAENNNYHKQQTN